MGEVLLTEAYRDLNQPDNAIIHFRRILEINPLTSKRKEIEEYIRSHMR